MLSEGTVEIVSGALPLASSLVSGERYLLKVSISNKAGLHSDEVATPAFGIDASEPVVNNIDTVATFCDHLDYCDPQRLTDYYVGVYQSDTSSVRVAWAGFDDDQSGIAAYTRIEIYEKESGETVASAGPFDWNGPSGEYLLTGLALQDSGVYHARVIAFNGAGLINNVHSGGPALSASTPQRRRRPVMPSVTSR